MKTKLNMRNHKVILSILLFVLLIVTTEFGGRLAATGADRLQVMSFSMIFLNFVLLILALSMLIRTRDDLHSMHEETRQHFHNVHERIKKK